MILRKASTSLSMKFSPDASLCLPLNISSNLDPGTEQSNFRVTLIFLCPLISNSKMSSGAAYKSFSFSLSISHSYILDSNFSYLISNSFSLFSISASNFCFFDNSSSSYSFLILMRSSSYLRISSTSYSVRALIVVFYFSSKF